VQLNRIRNNVMHPVRGGMLTEEEFEFVYNLEADLGPLSAPEIANQQPKQEVVANGSETGIQESPELVSKLEPVNDFAAPKEDASTAEQASTSDFIPSVKAS
jgi:hypothetical protein